MPRRAEHGQFVFFRVSQEAGVGKSRTKEEIVLKGEQITLSEKTPIFLSNFQIPVMQIRWTISATS